MDRIVWEAIRHRAGFSFQEWQEATKGWEYRPFFIGGELAAVVMVKGAEVHVVTAPAFKGRGLSRRLFRSVLGEIYRRHGEVITRVSPGHEEGKRLARWLGFTLGDDGIYRIGAENVWCK